MDSIERRNLDAELVTLELVSSMSSCKKLVIRRLLTLGVLTFLEFRTEIEGQQVEETTSLGTSRKTMGPSSFLASIRRETDAGLAVCYPLSGTKWVFLMV